MKRTSLLFLVIILSLNLFVQKKANITVNANQPKHDISKHVYGHFAEHLGRCIYDGFWVDPSRD